MRNHRRTGIDVIERSPLVRACTGRWRRSAREAGQAALIMVVGLSVLLMTIGAMMVQQTIQTAPLLQADSVQHYAYRALQAGMNTYQSIVNTNPNLANCNTSTNGSALCVGARYQEWNLVSNTNGGGGVVPEWYLFDNPQPVFNADGSLATLQVQIVGVAGFPNHYAYQSSVANLAPVNGFLTVVWWSDYEASDPAVNNPNYISGTLCQYDWNNGYNGAGPNCGPVYFGPSDTINGPVFSNDSIYVSNGGGPNGPNFGAASPWASVKTHDPNCIFTDPSCPMSDPTNVGHYAAPPLSADNQPHQTAPVDDAQLAQVAAQAAPNNGCVYYGPTTITLTGSTMTVTSPDTKIASVGCPLSGTSGSLPPNGVVFVNDAVATAVNPNSQLHGAGTNPFDDSAHNGRYAQTCGNYNNASGSSMPCYFGWTGSAKQDTEGDAFVSGNLAGSASVFGALTIGTSNDIIIDGNLTYSDCSGNWKGTAHESACNYRTDGKNDALGLIAQHYVEVDHPIDPQNPANTLLPVCGSSAANAVSPPLVAPLCQPLDSSNNITIDAAVLALNQSFGANNYATGRQLGDIILYGSLQQEARGAIGLIGNSGFLKFYTWDPRLELAAPPSYLNPGTSSYAVDSSSISPKITCPPLKNVYGTAGTTACPVVPAP